MKTKQGKIRFFILIILLFVCLVISAVFAVSIGSSKLEFGTVYRILTDQLFFGGRGLEAGAYEVAWYHVVWDIRLPRVLFGLLCGSGLSVCGAVMQSLVMNPIADPYILGISSGASAGAAWALLMPLPFFAGQYQVTAAALAGALLSSLAVYTMASAGSHGQIKPVTLILQEQQ